MDNAENTIERYVEEAINYFSDLPSEKTREYEKKIAKYAESIIIAMMIEHMCGSVS